MYVAPPNPFETPERKAFRDLVRRFVAEEITPYVDEWDERGEVPRELHVKAGAIDLYGLGIDEQYGGLGFSDAFMSAALYEEFAACGCGGVQAALFSRYISQGLVHSLASERIKKLTLPGIMSGEKISALAITEPSGGSDVAGLKTRARREGDEWLLNGSKTFITSGMLADYYVVAARTGGEGMHGISLFLLEKATPGFSQTPLDKQGWWCSDTATLYFQDCRLPADHLLGEENAGFLSAMDNFNMERLTMGAHALGSSKVCRDQAREYARSRETFGKPLIEHQVIRHKLVEMTARINALEAYLEKVCWRVNEGDLAAADID